jgi:hypothetical protein
MAKKRAAKKSRVGLGAIRTYDNGFFYTVSFGEREIRDFRSKWPGSGMSNLRSVAAQFGRRDGDLVDLACNGRSCERFDGPALLALTEDMQCAATRRGAKARAPKDHCRR